MDTSDTGGIKIDTRRRVAGLDGLRALAALAVVAYHLGLRAAGGGGVGVDWFFVLSGFLVTSVILGELDRSDAVDLRRFYRRRLARLVPALAATLVTVLAVLALVQRSLLADAAREALAAALYISNMTDLGADETNEFFLHTWTLSLEMQFYLVLPFLLIAVRRRGWSERTQVTVCLALAVACAATRAVGANAFDEMPVLISLPIFDLDRFLFGIALAVVLRSEGFARAKRVLAGTALAVAAFVVCAVDVYAGQFWPDGYHSLHNLVICPAIALVIGHVMVSERSILARALAWRPLTAIGLISYSLYLWHFPIFELLRDGVVLDGYDVWRNVAKLPISFGVAWLSYLVLERPVMLGRRARPTPADPAPSPGVA